MAGGSLLGEELVVTGRLVAVVLDGVDEAAGVRQVLDGMLRERSGGEPGAVLHTETYIGLGTK